jgi:membrane-associated protein
MLNIIDIFLHLDTHLSAFIQLYHNQIYVLLFLVIFIETGIVIFPFLPGDSLLFAVGALAGAQMLNVWFILGILCSAAILGDSVNYWVGNRFGKYLFKRNYRFLFTPENLKKTEEFYHKHGTKTIALARFVPIIRTIAPFIAGMGNMRYASFIIYNIVGGIVWISIFIFAGFFFGNIPVIKEQLHWVFLAIILISLIPIVWTKIKKLIS